MLLCEKRKMDGKNRVNIPTSYILGAGGSLNGTVYISFDEETKEIKISFQKEHEKESTYSR